MLLSSLWVLLGVCFFSFHSLKLYASVESPSLLAWIGLTATPPQAQVSDGLTLSRANMDLFQAGFTFLNCRIIYTVNTHAEENLVGTPILQCASVKRGGKARFKPTVFVTHEEVLQTKQKLNVGLLQALMWWSLVNPSSLLAPNNLGSELNFVI